MTTPDPDRSWPFGAGALSDLRAMQDNSALGFRQQGRYMRNNDVLRSLRNLLGADAAQMAGLARLSGGEMDAAEVEALLRRPEDSERRACSDVFLAQVLDGLVVYLRGRDDSQPPRPLETPVTNNMVLKKLRVAFELQEADLQAILEAADVALTKYELNALFRKPGNKHYRPCSDELLDAFIEGMAMCGWGGASDDDASP